MVVIVTGYCLSKLKKMDLIMKMAHTHSHTLCTPSPPSLPPVNPSLIYTLTDTRKSYSGLSHAVKIREQLKNLVKSFGVAIESADGKRETYFNFHPL